MMNLLKKMRGAAGGLLPLPLLLLTVAVVDGQNGWSVTCSPSHICAAKRSTVTITCSYTYPYSLNGKETEVQSCFWFTKKTFDEYVNLTKDPEYSNRVTYNCSDQVCDLTISDLRPTDSNVYKFRFTTNHDTGSYTGEPGVRLSVTPYTGPTYFWISVRRSSYRPSTVDLTCHRDCRRFYHVSYIWYKNGENLWRETGYPLQIKMDSTDRYQCAIKGYEWSLSLAVYAPKPLTVFVHPSGEIMEGSRVTLTCSSDANPAANYTWNKEDGSLTFLSNEQQHVFSSIQASDSGEYYCKAENDLGSGTSESLFINVKYPPKFSSVSVSPSGPIEEGKSVILRCSTDANPAAKYTWYKDGKTLLHGSSVYRVPSVTSKDRGNYICMSGNRYGQRNSSSVFVDVLYAPKPPTVSVDPSGVIHESSSVTLTCRSDANPAAKYTWYNRNTGKAVGHKDQLVFTSIKPFESGQYYCEAENNRGNNQSQSVDIDVKYAPRPPTVSVHPSGEIMEGSSVTLTCSSDANPAANYTWYKEGKDSLQASGQNFTISNIKPEDRGKYFCGARNKNGQYNSTTHMINVAGSWTSAALGTSVVIFLFVVLVLVFLVWRHQKSAERSPELGESPSIIKEQPCEPEMQDDLQYASVRFLKSQTDALYMNFQPAEARRPKKKENESLEYATVQFHNNRSNLRTEAQEPAEDLSALYSEVSKHR